MGLKQHFLVKFILTVGSEYKIGYQMAWILGVPDDYELVCILPVGIPETAPVKPVKKSFDERAWFNIYGKGSV